MTSIRERSLEETRVDYARGLQGVAGRLRADASLGEVFDQEAEPNWPSSMGAPAEQMQARRCGFQDSLYNDPDIAFDDDWLDREDAGPSVGRVGLWCGVAFLGVGLVAVGSWPLNGLGVLGLGLALLGGAGLIREVVQGE
ncbi:hypothetical protein [Nesterenkonia sp.]|uniref:hypothetical protein n=1 Tax=Nesterenkonia sp. TaxID=704201 RepID=UPI0026190922|nr:hypothetical protein [Nesterenkonia sp.]